MIDGETIIQMYNRSTNIVVGLKALGKHFPNAQLVEKLLYKLHKEWRPEVIVVEEARYLNTFRFDELAGSHFTYELSLNITVKEKKN